MSTEDNNLPDLDQVIEDSVNDATTPEVVDDVETTDVTEPSVEETTVENQIAAPSDTTTTEAEDDFDKKFGLQQTSVTGRENRIPYSRVKKIVAKAEKDAADKIRKELEGKTPTNFSELETKAKSYDELAPRVREYENLLDNNPREFLGRLSQHPAYKEFFAFVEQAAALLDQQKAEAPADNQPYLNYNDAPQPDQVLADGTKVYSLEGLAKREEWLARKIEEKAIQQAEDRLSKRYAPIEQQWQAQQAQAELMPKIERQISEARQWDKFNELEPKIIEILKSDRSITLDRAYLKAYQEEVAAERERLTTDRNKIRTEMLAEIKKKPAASAAPTGVVKPVAKTTPKVQTHPDGTPIDPVEAAIFASLEESGLK